MVLWLQRRAFGLHKYASRCSLELGRTTPLQCFNNVVTPMVLAQFVRAHHTFDYKTNGFNNICSCATVGQSCWHTPSLAAVVAAAAAPTVAAAVAAAAGAM